MTLFNELVAPIHWSFYNLLMNYFSHSDQVTVSQCQWFKCHPVTHTKLSHDTRSPWHEPYGAFFEAWKLHSP